MSASCTAILRAMLLGGAVLAAPVHAQHTHHAMHEQHRQDDGQTAQADGEHTPDAMPAMPARPAARDQGELQHLDFGSQIGVRPMAEGLQLGAGHGAMRHGAADTGAPADARSADYSDGIGYGPKGRTAMLGNLPLWMLRVDRLGLVHAASGSGVALDAQAWYGTDADKLWLKAEGNYRHGQVQDLRSELLWARPVAAFWNMQLGLRHDAGVGPGRSWAAFGIQGLAPYWFGVEATFYLGPGGRTAFRLAADYELLLTQRLVLEPSLEASFYGRDDPRRGIGSGLANAELGVRLRYAVTRKFAPYVGVTHERAFGRTAELARAAGERVAETRLVAGLRFWF